MNILLHISLQEILTTYSLFPIGLGYLIYYFIKRRYDLKDKKVEVRHTLFQENRILAITTFFSSYRKSEKMWRDLHVYQILTSITPLSPKDLDILLAPKDDLETSLLNLKLFLSQEEFLLFDQIVKNFEEINTAIYDIYQKSSESPILMSNRFDAIKEKMIMANKPLFNEIATRFQNMYETK